MSNTLSLLLKLIEEDKSINEISNIMGIDNIELYRQMNLLKKSSINFNKEYCYNANIFYKKVNSKKQLTDDFILYTDHSDDFIKAIVISDLHLCSEFQRLDLLKEIYNYAMKNNINIIFNCGDLIDGVIGKNNNVNSLEQIHYFIENYPFNKNIINFICLGNHDESIKIQEKRDVLYYLDVERHDLVCLGYGTGVLNIKNDKIILKYPETNGYKSDHNNYSNKLILKGHSHFMKFINSSGNNVICVPSLSNIFTRDSNLLPSAVLMNLEMSDGMFINGEFSQLIWNNNNFVKINTIETSLSLGKSLKKNIHIKNENRSKKSK